MSSNPKFSIKRQIKSILHATRGIVYFFTSEPKGILHVIFESIIIISGLVLKFSFTEWLIMILGMVILLATELLNTSIEELCDFIEPHWNEKIKVIKDLAAGAVFIITLALVALFLYISYMHLTT